MSNKADALVSPREDVIERTVAAIREADIPVGPWGLRVMSVSGMPFFFDPDAQPFVDAVRARLGSRYAFELVLAGCAMVTSLPEDQP